MADEQAIVDPTWLAAHLRDPDVRVVEVDVSAAAFDAGHIPGAVLWNAYTDLRGPDYIPVDRAALEGLLSRSGLWPESTLVLCGYAAALGFWLMKSHGHEDARVLTESREQWAEALGGLTTEASTPAQSAYPLSDPDPGMLVSREGLEAAISDPACVLLDVRSQEEFSGERFWPSGATEDTGRAGRVPGAVSVPIQLLRNEDETFKPPEELRRGAPRSARGRRSPARPEGHHLLHDRQQGRHGLVRPQPAARLPRRGRLLRLLGRVGQARGHAGRGLASYQSARWCSTTPRPRASGMLPGRVP
jgi:thiosulfate/3-mercaptopyruvate sulfurtransferase